MVNDEGQGMTDVGAAEMSGSGQGEGTAGMQTEQPRRVEPLHFPLWGSRLIEASAGTGKTYTIAALYLRLVLGHGERGTASLDAAYPPDVDMGFLEGAKPPQEATAFREALTPPKILVVTFTEAATLELRDRIRARLAEAAAFFRASAEAVEAGAGLDVMVPGSVPDQDLVGGQLAPDIASAGDDLAVLPKADPFLQGLRDAYPASQWSERAHTLQLAAEWMDESAISTIHGWCNRMLREHAFDSRGLFNQTLSTDTSELLAEACRDYWRNFCQGLPLEAARVLQGWWDDPDALQKEVQSLLSDLDALSGEGRSPAEAIGEAQAQRVQQLQALKAPWREGWIDELGAMLDAGREKPAASRKGKGCAAPVSDAPNGRAFPTGWLNGSKLRTNSQIQWLQLLRDWADDVERDNLGLTDAALKRLTPDGLRDAFGKDVDAQDPALVAMLEHPALAAIAALPGKLAALPDGRQAMLLHAARWIEARYRRARDQRSEMSFDDLLRQLAQALASEGGERLAERIRTQFPVAMIDEFQDTDPVQYSIFDRVYRVEKNCPEQALILIGDPKQAIYAFRGADIHTYLRAREATRGRHYTLDTNFRSSKAMVGAVNHVFEVAEQRPGGAFRFGAVSDDGDGAGAAVSLPFLAVKAQGRKEIWQDTTYPGGAAPALVAWTMPEDAGNRLNAKTGHVSKGAYTAHYAEVTAREIARLLQAGAEGQAGFARPVRPDEQHVHADQGDSRRVSGVRPADIAVLVNSGREADAVRKALRTQGIRSVYLSEDESVYASPVVPALLRWLQAAAEPASGRLLRAALGTALCGLDALQLERLVHDELHWEERVAQFQRYREIWRSQGVLPMVRHMLQDFGVVPRLLAQGGERQLTDLLHLSELLQQASTRLEGEHALVRYLQEQRDAPEGEREARRQRLESDDARVRVVTVHKSKGLEYPLVFLPFFCAVRPVEARDALLRWHDADGQLRLVPGRSADDEIVAAADAERLGEDLRKLYVALTRARHATWVGLGALENLHRSAAGHLLGLGDESGDGHRLFAALQEQVDQWREGVAPCVVAVEEASLPADGQDEGGMTQAAVWSPSERASGRGAVAWKTPPMLPGQSWPRWWIASYSALEVEDVATTLSPSDSPSERGAHEAVAAHGDAERVKPAAGDGWEAGRNVAESDAPYGDSALTDTWAEQRAADAVWQRHLVQAAEASALAVVDSEQGAGGLGSSVHDFARGPQAGTFLHGLLEWAGRQGFAALAKDPARLAEQVRWRLQRMPDWQPWQSLLTDWLVRLLTQPLLLDAGGRGRAPESTLDAPVDAGHAPSDGGSCFTLAGLRQYQVEMSFMLAVQDIDLPALDAWVRQHTFSGAARPPLLPGQLNGMLKGFIDLVFEHEGRFYVLDYKSNWLGASDEAYRDETMQAAVLAHRYELQYLFYLLALHRLLKVRLPDYDYDRHVGGALYLFLRGSGAPSRGVFAARPPRAVIEALDAAFAGQRPLGADKP
jgi:exodeoxyribonuclease V, beta subunit